MLRPFHKLFWLIGAFLLSFGCEKEQTLPESDDTCSTSSFNKKDVLFKGVSFESPANPITASSFQPIVDVNANSVSIIPFGFIYNGDSIVRYNQNFQWWGEKDEGVIALVEMAKSKGLKVMIKPQIWLLNGEFTGNLTMDTETQWQALEDSYRNYILHFTDIANTLNCEMVSIGTEFKSFVAERPNFWHNLIDSTRSHFNGAITYAENWDAFQDVPFWSKLDYIGIDAYFPLSSKLTPNVEELKNGWQPHLESITSIQEQTGIPVIFTEFGYRSVDYCGQAPWDSSNGGNVNLTAQDNAYTALFHTFWDKDWFEGGFVWKWFPNHATSGGVNDNRFTPQNKPAEINLQAIYNN